MNSLQRIGLKYGVLGFILYAFVFGGMYSLEMNPYTEIIFLDFLMIPILVFFALLEYRGSNDGVLEYVQGMGLGTLTVIVLSFLSTVFILVFHFAVDRILFEAYVTESVTLLASNKDKVVEEMGIAAFNDSYENLKHMSFSSLCFDNFWKKNILGLLLTVMIAIILRKPSKRINGQ